MQYNARVAKHRSDVSKAVRSNPPPSHPSVQSRKTEMSGMFLSDTRQSSKDQENNLCLHWNSARMKTAVLLH